MQLNSLTKFSAQRSFVFNILLHTVCTKCTQNFRQIYESKVASSVVGSI